MESFKLINGVNYLYCSEGIDIYYGEFVYKATVHFPCIGRVRYYKDVAAFHSRLDQSLYSSWSGKYGGTLRETILDSSGIVNDLDKFIAWKNTPTAKKSKLVTTKDKLTIYFNDHYVIKDFLDIFSGVKIKGTYRVKKDGYTKGVVYHKKPTHKWRIYLSGQNIAVDEALDLYKFLSEYDVKPCRTLLRNLDRRYSLYQKYNLYIYPGNFIDTNSEHLTTIMGLRFPTLMKRVCSIETK